MTIRQLERLWFSDCNFFNHGVQRGIDIETKLRRFPRYAFKDVSL